MSLSFFFFFFNIGWNNYLYRSSEWSSLVWVKPAPTDCTQYLILHIKSAILLLQAPRMHKCYGCTIKKKEDAIVAQLSTLLKRAD